MLHVQDFDRLPVYRDLPEKKRLRPDGTPRDLPRLGKVHFAVFDPAGRSVVGFMVKLPDIAGMVKQPDRFAALDMLSVRGGELVLADDHDALDARAADRLGVDLADCLIWTGMDVRTESGASLGYCADATFDFKTGSVGHFILTEGASASALLGNIEMPSSYLMGYREGCMVVSDAASGLSLSGGAAAKAAEASVVVAEKAKAAGKKVSEQAGKTARALDSTASVAVEKGSRALGRQLKKSKGMFSGFMSEYKKAAGSSAKK